MTAVAPSTDALVTENLCKNFGALQVTNGVNFRMPRGCRHALIGPNGSGKTTLINLLGGALTATSGKIVLGGTDVTNFTADRRVSRGLTRTFQVNQLFPHLTPIEAVTMAVCQRRGIGGSLWRSLKGSREEIDEAYIRRLRCTYTYPRTYGSTAITTSFIQITSVPFALL